MFNIENADNSITGLKKGNAADYDGLSAEHFEYAHPSITCCLFSLMLYAGYVPDAFGNNLTFPIPKDKNKTISASMDDFRPISICPIMSKIFEHCIL